MCKAADFVPAGTNKQDFLLALEAFEDIVGAFEEAFGRILLNQQQMNFYCTFDGIEN